MNSVWQRVKWCVKWRVKWRVYNRVGVSLTDLVRRSVEISVRGGAATGIWDALSR